MDIIKLSDGRDYAAARMMHANARACNPYNSGRFYKMHVGHFPRWTPLYNGLKCGDKNDACSAILPRRRPSATQPEATLRVAMLMQNKRRNLPYLVFDRIQSVTYTRNGRGFMSAGRVTQQA